MSDIHSPAAAHDELVQALNESVGAALRSLLETKHVYQRVNIDVNEVVAAVRARIAKDLQSHFASVTIGALTTRLIPADQELAIGDRGSGRARAVILPVQNVKTFCTRCDAVELLAPVWYTDITSELGKPFGKSRIRREEAFSSFQLFVLAYQCQRCHGDPEAFMVRREGWHLILDGRSPMEHVAVPSFIPKTERHLFRDALIAMHGGKNLAALFYLRTFIEQFARRQTGVGGKATGDEIMTAYARTLPEKNRDSMPSLRDLYDQLSEPIHSAREDTELFESAREEIEKHFDIRRVFQIPEKP